MGKSTDEVLHKYLSFFGRDLNDTLPFCKNEGIYRDIS